MGKFKKTKMSSPGTVVPSTKPGPVPGGAVNKEKIKKLKMKNKSKVKFEQKMKKKKFEKGKLDEDSSDEFTLGRRRNKILINLF
jgi:hypothetical protein